MGNCSTAGKRQPVLPKEKSGCGSNSSHRRSSSRKDGLSNKLGFSPIKPQRVGFELGDLPTNQWPRSLERVESDLSNPRSFRSMAKDMEDFRRNAAGAGGLHVFSYEEIAAATRNFRPDKILGQGGFGVVYKGVVDEKIKPGFTSTQVAIKELNPDGHQGDREWLAEISYLGHFSHPNLVKLIGYCCEDQHRLLVYDYMAGGSLDKHLFRRVCVTLTWPTRVKILLGAAKGLAFLHEEERPLIYRDFKTSNILLDKDYNARLSDFGLAKEGPTGDQTHVTTRVMGTYGYAAPEYVMTGHLTSRSDVYGYGVVLFEMLTGRKAMDKSRPSTEQSLVDWGRPLLINKRKMLKIVDTRIQGQYSDKAMQKMAVLAYECLSQNPKHRPTMRKVVEVIESLIGDFADARGEDALLPNGAGGSAVVTLYQAPEYGRSAGREKDENRAAGKRRTSGEGRRSRSRSEPALEYEQDSLGNGPKPVKSSSTRASSTSNQGAAY